MFVCSSTSQSQGSHGCIELEVSEVKAKDGKKWTEWSKSGKEDDVLVLVHSLLESGFSGYLLTGSHGPTFDGQGWVKREGAAVRTLTFCCIIRRLLRLSES